MAAKAFLIVCASALFVQVIAKECLRARAPTPIYRPPCDTYYDNIITSNLAPASGGGLAVISSSLYAPNGLSVLSENKISGDLAAAGIDAARYSAGYGSAFGANSAAAANTRRVGARFFSAGRGCGY